MPRTLELPTRTRVRVGSLRDTLGVSWAENAERLVDTATFFGGTCHVDHDLFDPCADDLVKEGAEGEGSLTNPVFGFYESGTCTTAADPDVIERVAADVVNRAGNNLSYNVERGFWNGQGRLRSSPRDLVPRLERSRRYQLWRGCGSDPRTVRSGRRPRCGSGRGERALSTFPISWFPFLQFYGQIDRQGNVLSLNHTDHVLVAGHRVQRRRT